MKKRGKSQPKGKGKDRKKDGKVRKMKMSKDERKKMKEDSKMKKKAERQTKNKKNKMEYKKLVQNSKKCFVQLFKFTSGMTCAICDANYAKFTTGNTIKVDKSNCDRLMAACYPYLSSRKEMGSIMKENKKRRKMRNPKNKEMMEAKKLMVEECIEDREIDATLECSGFMADYD